MLILEVVEPVSALAIPCTLKVAQEVFVRRVAVTLRLVSD